jgi:glycosyltransferase involved in cell wall biosynthesis
LYFLFAPGPGTARLLPLYTTAVISFCIPAHNEEALIGATVVSIRGAAAEVLAGRPWEVIVANDASTDRTRPVAEAAGARVIDIDRRQISAARNAAAAAATRAGPADLLVFVDADTTISADVLRAAVRAVGRGFICGGAAVTFDGEIPVYARFTLKIALLLFRLSRLSGGAFFFARRDHFDAVGGWDERLFASEEIALARALKRRGRFAFLSTPVVTSGRKLRTYSALEIFGALIRLSLRGPRGMRSREALGLWYEPRRPDPHLQNESSRPGVTLAR